MRIEDGPNGVHIILSERNLRTLLVKLNENHKDWSKRSIFKIKDRKVYFITSEDDETHYADREPPGEMHPQTEKDLESWTLEM